MDCVVALLYQLVFHAVGYTGPAANYALPGPYYVYQGAVRTSDPSGPAVDGPRHLP